jgi:predicted PurR-regulated permease PerM
MTDSQKWLFLAMLVAGGGVLYLLSPVLTPFLVSMLLAYLGDPIADVLEKKLPRSVAVSVVFLTIFLVVLAIVLVLLPLLEHQISNFVQKAPVYIDRIQNVFLPWLMSQVGLDFATIDFGSIKEVIQRDWARAGNVVTKVMSQVSQSGLLLAAWLANLVLIPVLTFYLLRDWDIMVARIHELIPRRFEPTAVSLATESDNVLGAFLRGQLSVMAGLAAVYSIGLWIVGLDFALLIGLLAGAVSFVPYLGFLVGILVASIVAMLQFQDVVMLVPIAIVFGIGQLMESFVFTPLFVGDRIGLHPVAVIFAVMAGGQLFGFFGILLALPVAAVIMVILRHGHERYVQSRLYS